MNKRTAHTLRTKFGIKHQHEDALIHLTKDQVSEALSMLDSIQEAMEHSISDYALDLTHDLLDEETPQIVRTFWFSKGLRDYYLCIDGTGLIRAIEHKIPLQLFDQIINTLDSLYS